MRGTKTSFAPLFFISPTTYDPRKPLPPVMQKRRPRQNSPSIMGLIMPDPLEKAQRWAGRVPPDTGGESRARRLEAMRSRRPALAPQRACLAPDTSAGRHRRVRRLLRPAPFHSLAPVLPAAVFGLAHASPDTAASSLRYRQA